MTTKLVPSNKRKQIVDEQNDDKTAQELVNMTVLVPRTTAGIVVETDTEKIERKTLAQERKHERIDEQQKMAQHIESLMEKVF